jgi:succinoglycan biosynthesis transport protein ExoP
LKQEQFQAQVTMLQINRNLESVERPSAATVPSHVFQFAINFVRRQYVVIAVAVALTTMLGVVYLITTPPTFTASARMLIDTRKQQVMFAQQPMTWDYMESAMVASQVEVLKSENIARAVVKENHLTEDPDIVGPENVGPENDLWRTVSAHIPEAVRDMLSSMVQSLTKGKELIFGAPPPEVRSETELTKRAIGAVMGRVSAKRVGLTYVIEVGFQSKSPGGAAQIANAVVQAYINDQLEAKFQATGRATAWLRGRIAELKEQSASADRAVEDFKDKNNMISADGRLVNEQQVAELSSQLVLAKKRTADAQSRRDRVQSILRGDTVDTVNATVTDSLNNAVVTKLREKYLDDANKEADWSARFGRDHLAAVNLRNQMKGILVSIREELVRLGETYKSDLEIAKRNQDAAEKELADAVAQSQEANQDKVTLRQLESAAKTYRSQYDSLLQKYTEMEQQQSFPVTEARMITPAESGFKSSPVTNRVLSLAILGGLLLGAGIGWLREFWYRVFRTSKQVEAVLGKDSIALLPLVPTTKKSRKKSRPDQSSGSDDPRTVARGHGPSWIVLEAPFSRYAEEVRAIKLAIDVNREAESNKVIGFTSSMPEEGKSTTSMAVALLAAQANARVILIDCDLRNPSLSRHVAPRATIGLLEVLSGNAAWDAAICRDPVTNLAFMPAVLKSPLANSSELLASDDMKKLFERLRDHFDYIIVDLSPLVPIVDVRSALSFVDGYVLMIEWGTTAIEAVERAVHSAKAVSDKVIGVVLNKVDFNSLGRFDGEPGKYYYKNRLYARYGYVEH